MNGHRAKILRKWAKYDMKAEREAGREYRIVEHRLKHSWMYLIRGPRAMYKALKRRAYANRRKRSAAS